MSIVQKMVDWIKPTTASLGTWKFILYTILIEMGVMPELGQAVEEMDWR